MASSGSGTGSGCGSGSTGFEEQSGLIDERKQKRMLSNRESARRSRTRKQKHLDGLTAQIAQLKKENYQILTSLNITTQNYMNVENENSIYRAKMRELSHRLDSLNEIIHYINANNNMASTFENSTTSNDYQHHHQDLILCENPWSSSSVYLKQPIMASADVLFDHCY